MDKLVEFKVSQIKEVLARINESLGGNYEGIIKEIEQREGIVFLASSDKVRLAIGLYLDNKQVLKLFDINSSGSLRDKMAQILKKFVIGYKEFEGKDIKDKSLSKITINEVFKTLTYLRDSMYLRMWCFRRGLTRILKAINAEVSAKSYDRHGATEIYSYLGCLEQLLSSFNLASSFSIELWRRQIFEGARPTHAKVLRITLPGLLLLEVYTNYVMGILKEPELESKLKDIIIIPKFMLDYVRKIINNVGETTLAPLARLVAEELENNLKVNIMMYIPILSNDIIVLLTLYERNKIDIDSIYERGLVRWKI